MPYPNFSGVDAFTYTMTDPSGNQSTALVVVNVSPNGSILPTDPPGTGVDPIDNPMDPPLGVGDQTVVMPIASDYTPPQPGESDDVRLNVPQLGLGGLDDSTGAMTLPDSDRYREHGAAGKFLYDTMEILGNTVEFQEFNLQNVSLDNELLWQALDTINQQMRADDPDAAFLLQIATGTGVLLTAGYVAWILRGGMLASMLISSMPMWKGFDPLPLLAARRKKRKKKDEEEKSRQSAEAADRRARRVERLFTDRR